MLDVTSLIMTGVDGIHPDQAKLTFAMARHAAVDLAQVVRAQYDPAAPDRLQADDLERLRKELTLHGVTLYDGADAGDRLTELRELYEPYVHALGVRLRFEVPPWIAQRRKDNWQGSPWDQAVQAKVLAHPAAHVVEDHF
jgi:hypothetical protein